MNKSDSGSVAVTPGEFGEVKRLLVPRMMLFVLIWSPRCQEEHLTASLKFFYSDSKQGKIHNSLIWIFCICSLLDVVET